MKLKTEMTRTIHPIAKYYWMLLSFISKHLFSGYKLYFIIYIDKYIHIHSHICIICKHVGHTCKKQKE